MNLTTLLVMGLAAWRVTSLFVRESGPLDIFCRIREFSGITHDEHGHVLMIPDRALAQLFSCMWCCSVWVGLFWLVFWMLSPEISILTAIPFALSAFTILIDWRN